MTRVSFRGKVFDSRTRDQLMELERLLGAPLSIMQGSYSGRVGASAGTHDGGGAFDADDTGMGKADRDRFIIAARKVGFAAWWRPTIAGKWGSHFHGISIGCADLAPSAARQVTEYYNGGDGLTGSNPDPHRALNAPKQTWEKYLASRYVDTFPLPPGHSFGTPRSSYVHDGTEGPVTADNVRKIKRRLRISTASGVYGPYTRLRVIAWQIWKKIKPTGRVGAETWREMRL